MMHHIPWCFLLWSLSAHAQTLTTTTVTHTKQQMASLTKHIELVRAALDERKTIGQAHTKQLKSIEKQISDTLRQQHAIKPQLLQTQQIIQRMQAQAKQVQRTLAETQYALSQLIRLRYELPKPTRWYWLLQQTQSQTINRALAYHYYLLKQQNRLMQTTQQSQQQLQMTTHAVLQQQQRLTQLENELQLREHRLLNMKNTQTVLLTQINQSIDNKQQLLTNYHNDKTRLTRLLTRLSLSHAPTANVTSKLAFIHPLAQHAKHAAKLKQGLIFYAPEGEEVSAISSGKVIFSDWLNGYGLLLIVDHGDGLMSLYAHNQTLFKQLGEPVNSGEHIATVGHTGGLPKNGLYFELRRHGKVIPPGEWLA